MKKAIIAAIFVALVFLAPMICNVNAGEATQQASVADLVKNPGAFNDRKVALQGFVVSQQIFGKPTQYYLRDESDNMIALKLSKNVDLSKYSKIAVTGVFNADNKEIHITDEVTPLEKIPEAQFVTGPQNTIVIMAYFTDRVNNKNQAQVHYMIFNDMNGYYTQVSYDWVYVTGIGNTNGWYPWVNVGNTVGFYGLNDNTNWIFIRDAVAKVDAAVNFAGYSKFIFVCAGPNQESSGVAADIWSCRWSGLAIATNDGVTITHGMIVPDIEQSPYGVLGVHAHEYAHELGLPDLYTYPSNILQYDLMDSGSWNNLGNTPAGFTSWCKMAQGWIMSGQIFTVNPYAGQYLRLDPLEDATAAISVIKVPVTTTQYYLIEGRRKVGFDAYIPNERILVLYFDGTRVYKRAELTYGQQYEAGSFGVIVLGSDLEGWSYNVYVWYKTWTADTRLTNAAGSSDINYGHKAIATAGSYVYTTWDDTRDGNWEIYFKRSTNFGSTWEADQRLTVNASTSWYPSIAAYGTYVYVVWQEFRDGNWEIYLKYNWNSGMGGIGWYADRRLTINTASSYRPSVAAYGRNVYVVWYDYRDGNAEIYFKRSTNCAETWGADTRLTVNNSISQFPNVAAFGSNVYVVWEDFRYGNWDIFFKRSTDSGVSWSADTRLTTSTSSQRNPSIAAWGYDVHVVWEDYRYGASNSEIFERRSLNSGVSWMTEIRLTSATYLDVLPVVAAIGKSVYVVWESNRTGTWEIYFKESPNRGLYWTGDRRLSATGSTSQWPSIAVGGADWADVYVVWSDYRNGASEIYFKYRW